MDFLDPEDEVNTQDVGGNPKAEQTFDENDLTDSSKSLASTEDDKDSQDEYVGRRSVYLQIPYGFQSKGCYRHASKNCEIVGVTHNSRFRQFVFLDSRGITSWSYESVYSTVTRYLNYPAYQFNVLRLLIFSRKFNVYFALSKEYALKVFNLNFHEVFSVAAEMHSVLCMVFNHSNDELITGGTGGMKFWTFGEIDHDGQKAWERDSRPMANYGLVLRASYPHMGGSWVKQVELDEAMQRLYCLSERNVVAYDMEGNLLFQILDAHRGPVTGCVYSKAANFLVTVGNDCDINVWSRSKSGGKVHTFTGHSKAITKIMLHPESSALIITAAMDGSVKIHSLDIMEEIYSLSVFSEGIFWMNCVSTKLIYCCSNRVIEVFSLNHLTDFWALTRCSVTSLSLVTCNGKSSRVMAVGNDSSVRLISRKRENLSTVLPPPPISPLNMVKDVTYSRDFNMMYLLINEQEIWVYYTRTNPATRVESWTLDYIEDIHSQHSHDPTARSRCTSPWLAEGNRSPSSFPADIHSLGPSSLSAREACGRESLPSRKERVKILCLGMLYSPIIMASVEGDACPDATQFLVAGTQDGRVLFLHMFCKGLKFHQIQANKDAVLSVHHDQVMNTLVTKCRHPGIAVLIWSLPYLGLLKRVDCEADLTCYTRMNTLLICGHESGYLHIHHLTADKCERCEEMDDVVTDARRAPPKDHQDRVNSVDGNSTLEVFCSASQDGTVKLWDKEKTLLCEIAMDETLTVASFLNNQGDILVGFNQHIFVIPRTRVSVYPTREDLNSAYEADLLDDEAFETESDIYEDPSVRYESKKILQPDPTNMENYLVPFPNLLLKTSWFMEGRAPPDLNQQNQQDDEEPLSVLSDTLSLAPTEVYCSPSATPRSMSLASVEGFSVLKGSVELWQLPEFGNSPVSTPPRTPPPEPTPPSTPSLGEESEEEDSEGEAKEGEETQQENAPPCGQCVDATKKDTKKKISFVPSFRREGGRLGNISIDSRSLRSGGGGGGSPGYAAPVHRRVAEQRPEPKPFKPRRIPKAVVKKFKKPKEKEEEAKKENGQEQQKNTETTEELSKEAENEFVDTREETEISDHSSRNLNVINKPSEEEKPVIREGTVSAPLVLKTVSAPQGQANLPSMNGDENAHQKGARGTQDAKPSQATTDTTEETGAKHSPQIKHPHYTTRDEPDIQVSEEYSNDVHENSNVTVKQGHKQVKPGKGSSPTPYAAPLVTYKDPDTGDIVQKPADEIPEGAEILEDYGNEEEIPEGDEKLTLSGQGLDSSPHKNIKNRKGRDGKNVRFSNGDKASNIPSRQYRRFPEVYSSGRDSPLSRSYAFGVVPKEAVVPIYDRNSPVDLIRKASKSDLDVSPLTIFALARNRKQQFGKPSKTRFQSARYPNRAPINADSDIESSKTDGANLDDFDLNDDDFARLIDRLDSPTSDDDKRLAAPLRPPSVKKQGSSLTRWCIRALQKSDREVLFPPKPMRPKSSPITSNAKVAKDEGNTLFLNVNQPKTRPRTADTIRSTGTGHEEYSRFPYENTAQLDDVTKERKSRDQKSASGVKVSSRKHLSPDEDEDLMDAYHAMRSSIGLHDVDEDYIKGIMPKGRGEYESVADLPVVETNDYSGDWQSKVLERARLLKQRRLERQKSATERRQAKENEQKERWRTSSHFECAPESLLKSESSIEFIAPPTPTNVPSVTTFPSQEETHLRSLKDQELAADRPYRLRMNFQSTGAGLSPAAKSLINLKSSDHNVSEIAHVLPKPPRSASIPSKCSRYVLVPQPLPKNDQPQATAMEQTLLLLRFPKSRVRRRHTSAAIPRPQSNPDVRLQTSFEL